MDQPLAAARGAHLEDEVPAARHVQQQALLSARKTRRYARELYVKGLTSFLEAVDAERTALELERQAVNLQGQQALYTVALIKALGGSW